MDNVNGFRCECATGFSGHNCEGLAEIQSSIKIILIDVDKFNDHTKQPLECLSPTPSGKYFNFIYSSFKK